MKQEMFCLALESSLTFYWDKPENAVPPYTVILNGNMRQTTDKTHITFDGLQPGTGYSAELYMSGTLISSTECETQQRRRALDVRDFGARGDGVTPDTLAIQAAIDACGYGEEVILREGTYICGAIRLHGNMALHICEGAVLQGTSCPDDYLPFIPSRFEGIERPCYSSQINIGHMDHTKGPECSDVLIYGGGKISGGGQELFDAVVRAEDERNPDRVVDEATAAEGDEYVPGRSRPRLINVSNCRNVRITGLTLENAASWNVHMIYSENVVTDHCRFNSWCISNGDGWDPDSSENCTLFACSFYTGDDAVAIKSGKNPEGNVIARPTKNVRIFDCVSEFSHALAIGSEMSGGIENVRIWDCDFRGSILGLLIKSTSKRGGYVRNIVMKDCSAPSICIIKIGYNDDGLPADEEPLIENCTFENVEVTGKSINYDKGFDPCSKVEIAGYDSKKARNIYFKNCSFGKDEIIMENVENVVFS